HKGSGVSRWLGPDRTHSEETPVHGYSAHISINPIRFRKLHFFVVRWIGGCAFSGRTCGRAWGIGGQIHEPRKLKSGTGAHDRAQADTFRPSAKATTLSRSRRTSSFATICAPHQWALNSAVECHLHTVEVIGSNPIAPTIASFAEFADRSNSSASTVATGASLTSPTNIIVGNKRSAPRR